MRYPVAVWQDNVSFSAQVPDLPEVITLGNSIEELMQNIEDAALGWMEYEIDVGHDIPKPSPIKKFLNNSDYADCIWVLAEINMNKLSDKVQRLNICLASRAIRQLDYLAKESAQSRFGYLT